MGKKLSQTMREEFAELEEDMEDFMMHTEITADEAGDQRANMMKAWNPMDKAYEAFKRAVKIFIRAQKTLNESKALDLVKSGKISKMSDDDLMDAASEIENKNWNKDNKSEVLKWVKDISAELSKRKLSGPRLKPKFESPGDGSKTPSFKQYFAEGKKTKIVTTEDQNHSHEGEIDDEGDGQTTKTLAKAKFAVSDHVHKISGADVKSGGKKKHTHLLKD